MNQPWVYMCPPSWPPASQPLPPSCPSGFYATCHIPRSTVFNLLVVKIRASMVVQMVKSLPEKQETWVWSLGQKDPLEEGMATHSNTLAWRIPWTEEPGGLQSTGSHRVRHNWATNTHTHTHTHTHTQSRNKDKANILLPPPNPITSKGMPVRLRGWRYDEGKWCHCAPFCWVAGDRGLAGAGQWLRQSLGLVRGEGCEGSPALSPPAPSERAGWRMAPVPVHMCTISRASPWLPASCPRALPKPWEFLSLCSEQLGSTGFNALRGNPQSGRYRSWWKIPSFLCHFLGQCRGAFWGHSSSECLQQDGAPVGLGGICLLTL